VQVFCYFHDLTVPPLKPTPKPHHKLLPQFLAYDPAFLPASFSPFPSLLFFSLFISLFPLRYKPFFCWPIRFPAPSACAFFRQSANT